ncbi:MAG: preprotein translocase subunit YajC [Gemmataceae bacterium]|nr:preprotein translocase subunit YajC [Gemmataceae bacterium]
MLDVLFAQEQGQQPPPFWANPMFLLALLALFWVVIILPMSRRQKREQQTLLASIARGAKVVTSAGIVGTVVSAKDGEDEIVIRSEDTRLRIKRNTVTQVLGTDASEANK